MVRTIEQWAVILNKMTAKDAAKRILGDVTHYNLGRTYEDQDIKQLANALLAFANKENVNADR